MTKVAILNLRGSFTQGFQAVLQVGEEGQAPKTGAQGFLPASEDLTKAYTSWRSEYDGLDKRLRLSDLSDMPVQFSSAKDCEKAGYELQSHLNQWLNAPGFNPVIQSLNRLINELDKHEELRVIIQNNEDELLRKLPWHLWEILQKINESEVAISSPEFETPKRIL